MSRIMDDIDWDALPPSTMPNDLTLTARGFNDPDVAQQFGRAVLEAVNVFGSFMDLSTLDGITVAIDYDEALAELDRGVDGLRPLSRSNTEMQGVAMSPAVMRDGEVRTHLVFDAAMLVPFVHADATADEKAESVAIIAHECAHVGITARKEAAVPNARLGTRIEGFERALTFQIAEICWDEYAACRISARFAPRQHASHADTLQAVLAAARDQANAAIRAYRRHRDIARLLDEAVPPLVQPIKVAAYLLGAMDGADASWADLPDARKAVEDVGYAELVDRQQALLRRLWESQEYWEPTLDVFQPLQLFATDVLRSGGLILHSAPDGSCRVDVPFSPGTF